MVNRQTQLSSGGTVLVRESVLRGPDHKPAGALRGRRDHQGDQADVRRSSSDDWHPAVGAQQRVDRRRHRDSNYVWYRNNPIRRRTTPASRGQWRAGCGNPGYLNSVGARCVETESDVDTSLPPEAPVVLKWDMAYLDTEEVPIVDSGTGL